ncbi:MAG: EAL domain-containing protein [Burkholderiales bacterium]
MLEKIQTASSGGAAIATCRSSDLPFTMAFQPIVNVTTAEVFAYEALVRGPNNESAASVISSVAEPDRYGFDQECRLRAVRLASRLGLDTTLSINFMPNAMHRPETCIRATLDMARELDFPAHRLMFEVVESERVRDRSHLKCIFREYKRLGFLTAIDDFGAGFSGLQLLADFQPDVLKLDMQLTRDIDADHARRAIVGAVMRMSHDLGIRVIAEGVERLGECRALRDLGVELMQGYLFAHPAFEALAAPNRVLH